MTCDTSDTVHTTSRKSRGPAGPTGAGRLVSVAGFGLASLALLAGGCGGGNLIPLGSSPDFQRQVLDSKKPVLVQFYKSGCVWCSLLEPTLDRLASDYGERAVFAKYCLKDWVGGVTNWEIRSKYDIRWYPTVILFVNGREKSRWVVRFDDKSCRKAMDEALAPPTKQAAPRAITPAPTKR